MKKQFLLLVVFLQFALIVFSIGHKKGENVQLLLDNIDALTQGPENDTNTCSGEKLMGYQMTWFVEEIEQYKASYSGKLNFYGTDINVTMGVTYYLCLVGLRCEQMSNPQYCCDTSEQAVDSYTQIALNLE